MHRVERDIKYKAFGLYIVSEFSLPELPIVEEKVDSIDVEIKIRDLSDLWLELSKDKCHFAVRENLVMFHAPNLAVFLIADGKSIHVSPIGDSDFDKIRLYILGTCMGALLLQRKILPLHGSAIVIENKAYAFVGERGAGKSTIASALIRRGYQLLTDDVIAITEYKKKPYVIPSYPQQKLWQESLHAFGECTDQFQPLFERETKFVVPVINNYYSYPLPLAGVFELTKTENNELSIKPLQKLEGLLNLYTHTFRQFLLEGLGLRQWHFDSTARLIKQIDMYQLKRSTKNFTANELATLVLKTIKKVEISDDRIEKDFVNK